jgi:nitrate/TMAO reductase-like tetraheme cytochrome c subunit|tara:strand:+ start:78 stop:755 length:678 start_codon:yes stop_codon:yes gene_type:complete
MELVTLVKIIGIISTVIGTGLCIGQVILKIQLKKGRGETRMWMVSTVSGVVLFKWLTFGSLFAAPAVVTGMANYHVFEGTKEVSSCANCHVMRPIVNDMRNPDSQTLAARHYKNRWIASKQCFTCHADYGLHGSMKAKTDGFRHLVKYTTGLYEEPIEFKGRYNNGNCLKCHEGTDKWEAVSSHQAIRPKLGNSSISCTNCHGIPHPTGAERTPGHPLYNIKRPE